MLTTRPNGIFVVEVLISLYPPIHVTGIRLRKIVESLEVLQHLVAYYQWCLINMNIFFFFGGGGGGGGGCGGVGGCCRVKNAYELLNLRALKFSPMNKIHIFQCMDKIFYVEFQRAPLIEKCNFYTTLKFKELLYLRARKHFWNAPQVPIKCICNCHDVDTGRSAHLRRDLHNVSVKVSSTRSRSHASTRSILVPISKHLPSFPGISRCQNMAQIFWPVTGMCVLSLVPYAMVPHSVSTTLIQGLISQMVYELSTEISWKLILFLFWS